LARRRPVTLRTLDVVVLNRPTHGLKRGDLGTVVDVYSSEEESFVNRPSNNRVIESVARVVS
jgi:hypothetical protein